MIEPATESQLDTRSAGRLVIRVKLIPPEPEPPARWRLSRSALLLILGAVAIPLSWLGISFLYAPDATSPRAITATPVTNSAKPEPRAAEPEVRQQPDAPPAPVNEVIPDVPRSALQTIRGTVRVSVRVTVDKQGSVIEAVAVDRGPSRYFERLAVEASKQWTFTPANSEEQRMMLVRFNFTRAEASAHASPLQ
jgi:TonB family protein